VAKPKKPTSKDVPGKGAARKAAEAVEKAQETRSVRMDSIMAQIRRNQSTDSHQ